MARTGSGRLGIRCCFQNTCGTMDADGFSIVDNRAGVTFGVELYVPWDAPEMAVDLSSTG